MQVWGQVSIFPHMAEPDIGSMEFMRDVLLQLSRYSIAVSEILLRVSNPTVVKHQPWNAAKSKPWRALPSNLLHNFLGKQIHPTLIANISPNFDHQAPSISHPPLPKPNQESIYRSQPFFLRSENTETWISMISKSSTLTPWIISKSAEATVSEEGDQCCSS